MLYLPALLIHHRFACGPPSPLGKANARRIVTSNSPINQNLNAKWEDRGVNVIVGAIHESPAKPNWGLPGTLNAPHK